MKTTDRKPCQRCGRSHNRKGFRYCDPCERIVVNEMYESRYLEDRHMRSQLPKSQPKTKGAKP